MALCNTFKGCFQIVEGVDVVDLGGFDQGCDAAPGFAALVMAREEGVLAIEAQFPFILPMSGRFIGFIIDGMPILART